MASIVVAGDTSGTVTLSAPATAGTTTLTLPTTTGNVVADTATQTLTNKTLTSPTITGATITVASTAAPAFSAYNAGTQSISASTSTKVVFNAEDFDTANCFDSTTNYRFTPNVAGYYQFNANVYQAGGSYAYVWLNFYKNGSSAIECTRVSSTGQGTLNGSALIYLNGSTDYVELYARSQGGTTLQLGASSKEFMNFSGAMIRSA
jgi:hypothetical protein